MLGDAPTATTPVAAGTAADVTAMRGLATNEPTMLIARMAGARMVGRIRMMGLHALTGVRACELVTAAKPGTVTRTDHRQSSANYK
jgi:hypothetical protein